jgi:hypothetical protein
MVPGRLCTLCGREAKGLGYVHMLALGQFPYHRFCSIGCSEAGCALARRSRGMIDKTPMERRAVIDARRPLAVVLDRLGLMVHFHGRSAADIDQIIEACFDGIQASLRRQAAESDTASGRAVRAGAP